jgi:hypothetical protein
VGVHHGAAAQADISLSGVNGVTQDVYTPKRPCGAWNCSDRWQDLRRKHLDRFSTFERKADFVADRLDDPTIGQLGARPGSRLERTQRRALVTQRRGLGPAVDPTRSTKPTATTSPGPSNWSSAGGLEPSRDPAASARRCARSKASSTKRGQHVRHRREASRGGLGQPGPVSPSGPRAPSPAPARRRPVRRPSPPHCFRRRPALARRPGSPPPPDGPRPPGARRPSDPPA